jgi:hypothetical protein
MYVSGGGYFLGERNAEMTARSSLGSTRCRRCFHVFGLESADPISTQGCVQVSTQRLRNNGCVN